MTPKRVDGDVGVLVKAMDVLDALADESPLTVAELVARTGVSKAAAYRIVQTMERRAYLVREADRGRYSLGPALYGLGRVARSSTNLVRAARPAMESLSAEFAETVNLGVLSSGDVIYIDTIDSDQHLRTSVQIAHRDSVYSTALGKAMLAALSDEALESYLDDFVPARRTVNTKVTRSAFVDDLVTTRARWLLARRRGERDRLALRGVRHPRRWVAAARRDERVGADLARLVRGARQDRRPPRRAVPRPQRLVALSSCPARAPVSSPSTTARTPFTIT